MRYLRAGILMLVVWTVLEAGCAGGGGKDGESRGQCDGDKSLCTSTSDPRLVVIPPVKVGHTEVLELEPGRTRYRRTLSVNPPIFEIDDFLTGEECQHLKRLALAKGLERSDTYRNPGTSDVQVQVTDVDGNKLLSIDEMRLTIQNSFDVYLSKESTRTMYKEIKIDKNGDGMIDPGELSQTPLNTIETWLHEHTDQNLHARSRNSEQVWLYPDRKKDKIVSRIQNRVVQLTGLLPGLVENADLQIVHYRRGGHYHAHYDSSPSSLNLPCCRTRGGAKDQCRVCRFMTILFYLNDVDGGGGTAFPVADNSTFDATKLRINHQIDLQEHCHDANLLVAPSRGKVVMWYNHQVAAGNGWMGDMEEQSVHGGCPVTSGEKWIANFWIRTSNDKYADIELFGL